MLTTAAVARAVRGDVSGRDSILAPGPGHSARDRSLSIRLSPRAPDGFICDSFAGDDFRACRDHVRECLNLGGFTPDVSHPIVTAKAEVDGDRTERALALWREAGAISGSPAAAHLAGRGVSYTGDALRWHPSCPFGKGQRHGCMIGLVRNIVTDEPQAIHRTAIDANGRKIDRKAYGPIGGGAVKLTADADVTCVLAIGEGIETTLSIRELPDLEHMPVWAVLNAGGIAAFPVLPGIETTWIAVDNDVTGAGQNAAHAAGGRLHAAGIEVITLTPKQAGADLNDRLAHA